MQRTFAIAHELYANLLVHIFAQIENGFFFRLIVDVATSAAAAMPMCLLH
mgnify:CR=1 FL=1